MHPVEKVVDCHSEDGLQFKVRYDKLVIATGSQVCEDRTSESDW